MRRPWVRTGCAALLALALTALATGGQGAEPAVGASAAAPVRALIVGGTDVAMFPAFRKKLTRYGITTSEATGGEVTVTATTTDARGSVRVNGRPAPGGVATVTGLTDGDEVSVFISDSGGTTAYSLVYLPAGFPALDVTVNSPSAAAGKVALTLFQREPAPQFDVIVDEHGVPVYVAAAAQGGRDLKAAPHGHYTVSRPTTSSGRSGSALVELDETFQPTAEQETVAGLLHTDSHDSITRPNGNRFLLAYETNSATGRTDAIIQKVDAEGNELFRWNSGAVPPDTDLWYETVHDVTVGGLPHDYAHVNSIWLMKDGNLLASFRHLSAVLKIATRTTASHEAGEILWRFGGRHSDFEFPAGDGGPCAQHAASQLPNGHILIYDNGSDAALSGTMCLDPADRSLPTIARPATRITEWELTPPSGTDPGTARIVWNYDPGAYGFFAGNAQRLPNGNTMVGWAATNDEVAQEVDPAGEVVWKLLAPTGSNGFKYTTYRAFKFRVPDKIAPVVDVAGPADGEQIDEGAKVAADFTCTDRGGSSLRACGGTRRPGALLDTRPGRHKVRMVAKDGAGNKTVATRSYVVVPAHQPDASIRRLPSGPWVGRGDIGRARTQRVRVSLGRAGARATALVRLENFGSEAGRVRVVGVRGTRAFGVRYVAGHRNVTTRVLSGTYRTARLDPGRAANLKLVVTRRPAAHDGRSITVRVRAVAAADPSHSDAVAAVVTATRR